VIRDINRELGQQSAKSHSWTRLRELMVDPGKSCWVWSAMGPIRPTRRSLDSQALSKSVIRRL